MRRLLFVLVTAVSLSFPIGSYAYSEEMKQLATLMNESCFDGMSVSYDGKSIIFDMPSNLLSEDEISLLDSCEDLQSLAPFLKNYLVEGLGSDVAAMFSSILTQFDTDMLIRLQLPSGVKSIRLTGNDLLK